MDLEEQHQAESRGKGLVLVGPALVFLGPGVVALSHYLERLGSLVVDATRNQGVLGLESRLAVGRLEEAGTVAPGHCDLAVGRSKGELADETVGIAELAIASHADALDRPATGDRIAAAHAVELQGSADALPEVTGPGEGEAGFAEAEPTARAYRGLGLVSHSVLGILGGPVQPEQDVAGFDGYLRFQPGNLGLTVRGAGIAVECRGLE